uniref:Fork-head domain-containing protein n=1 Tax=Ciona intestinalis TaxID=7719 RepID=F6QNW0_CIOIN
MTELENQICTEETRKPERPYVGLIAEAILDSEAKRLSLGQIYQYLEAKYLYFKLRRGGWKNSIRHNLSLNHCFIKVGRCEDGKGNYWTIHPSYEPAFQRGDFKWRRLSRRRPSRQKQKREEQETNTKLNPTYSYYESFYYQQHNNTFSTTQIDCHLPDVGTITPNPWFPTPLYQPAYYNHQKLYTQLLQDQFNWTNRMISLEKSCVENCAL